MEKVGSFLKIFSFCISSLFLFICCETSTAQKNTSNGCGGIILKPTRIIRIQDDAKNPNKIRLIDEVGCPAYTLNVLSGQNVEWQIDGSTIKSIDSIVIKAKPGNENIFEKPPHKQHLSKHWKGKSKNVKKIETEEYNILWTGIDNTSYTYDPIMQLNPK